MQRTSCSPTCTPSSRMSWPRPRRRSDDRQAGRLREGEDSPGWDSVGPRRRAIAHRLPRAGGAVHPGLRPATSESGVSSFILIPSSEALSMNHRRMQVVAFGLWAALLSSSPVIAQEGRYLFLQTNDIREGQNAVLGYSRHDD